MVLLGVPALIYLYVQAFVYAPIYIYSTFRNRKPPLLCGKHCYLSVIEDIKLLFFFSCISTMKGLPDSSFNSAVTIILITDLVCWTAGDVRICFIQNEDPLRFKYYNM